jgi:sulfate transport system ATP-binding protein
MGIRVQNVVKRFGDFVALDNVSVDIPTGSLTALLGPSGGGKSTLLRIIAGLEDPDSGSIEIEGQDSTALPPQRRNVGFVFQHYAAFKHMTVRGNVAFTFASSPIVIPRSSPAASASAWRWPAPSPSSRR